MKTRLILLLVCAMALAGYTTKAQGLVTEIEEEDLGVILNQPAFVTLSDGTEITGKLSSASLGNGYLKSMTIKLEDGSKRKLQAGDMLKMKVKASKLAKMSMLNESSTSVKEFVKTDRKEILDREYIFFEQALRATKKDKPAMMQLLNPGFDSKIKVFADPNARETNGIGIGGVQLTGGKDRSYLFVKNGEKAVIVRKPSYRKNFEELYGDCSSMIEFFKDDKIKWDDLAGHVYAYDYVCNKSEE